MELAAVETGDWRLEGLVLVSPSNSNRFSGGDIGENIQRCEL